MGNYIKSVRKRVYNYDKWVVLLLITMPLILLGFNGWEMKQSISAFVYMENNQVFYFLFFIAASMFGYNGALWLKNYQILLGAALAGIALTPHLEYELAHNIFAVGFFLGSIYIMIKHSSKEQRPFKIIAGAFIVFGMLGHFAVGWYSLFWAEWIGMLPIAIHYVGESLNIID